MIKTILFDIHGVLFAPNLERLAWQELATQKAITPLVLNQLKTNFKLQETTARFLQEFCPLCNGGYCTEENLLLPHNITLWLKGKRMWTTVYNESVDLINMSYEVKCNQYEPELMTYYLKFFLDPALYSTVVTPIQRGLDLLSTMKNCNKYKLFLASNSPKYCYDYYAKNYPDVINDFDDYFFSEMIQFMKNEPQFFEVIAKKYNLRLNEMFLIDDNATIISIAKSFGINGWCFRDDSKAINNLMVTLKKG